MAEETAMTEQLASPEELVTYELDGAIAVIGLNRAHKRNSISDDVIPQLRAASLATA